MTPTIRMLLAAMLLGTAAMDTRAAAQSTAPLAHRFIKVADDIYAAVGNGTIQTQDTVAVVVNRVREVLLVDTNCPKSPAGSSTTSGPSPTNPSATSSIRSSST